MLGSAPDLGLERYLTQKITNAGLDAFPNPRVFYACLLRIRYDGFACPLYILLTM